MEYYSIPEPPSSARAPSLSVASFRFFLGGSFFVRCFCGFSGFFGSKFR
jgi:hypothetical protein